MSNEGVTNESTLRMTSEATQANGAIVEPRTTIEKNDSEEMFLTPRVLDASAFSRYAETLKGIIAQASAQGRTLEDFSTDADAMIKRCNETSDSVNKRLQAGIRMLKMIDERAERTDLLLEKVQRALPDAQAVSDRIDSVIDERLAASESRIDELIRGAEERVQASERRAYEAIERTQEHAGELETLGQSIDARLASLRETIERSEQINGEGFESLKSRVDEARTEIDRMIAKAFDKAQEAGHALRLSADESINRIEARVEAVGTSMEPLMDAASAAMRTLGMDPENPDFADSPLSRIESLVDRGETQLASLDRVYRQIEDLQSQAESVRSAFGNWLVEAAHDLDTLEARKDIIVGPMQNAAETIQKLGPDLEQKLELASTELTQLQIAQKTLRETIAASSQIAHEVTDRMGNQSGQLQALLDGSLHKLSTRVEQAGVWLGTLIQRAETLGASMPTAGSMGFAAPAPSIDEPVFTTEPTPSEEPTGQRSAVAEAETIETQLQGVQDEVEQMQNYTIPAPPQLPIDSLSFDGASEVFEHKGGDDQAS
jgi:chromosome segregation ATPase